MAFCHGEVRRSPRSNRCVGVEELWPESRWGLRFGWRVVFSSLVERERESSFFFFFFFSFFYLVFFIIFFFIFFTLSRFSLYFFFSQLFSRTLSLSLFFLKKIFFPTVTRVFLTPSFVSLENISTINCTLLRNILIFYPFFLRIFLLIFWSFNFYFIIIMLTKYYFSFVYNFFYDSIEFFTIEKSLTQIEWLKIMKW